MPIHAPRTLPRRVALGILVTSLVALASFGLTAILLQKGWTTDVLDPGAVDSVDSTIDAAGVVHVAYTGCGGDGCYLRYATNAGGHWNVTQLDSEPYHFFGSFFSPSIALDAGGRVHVAYVLDNESYPPAIHYATNVAGTWVTSVAASQGVLPSIAISPSGRIEISYFIRSDPNYLEGIRIARQGGAVWNVSDVLVLGPGYIPIHVQKLAFDSHGDAYVALFAEQESGGLGYVTDAAGTWQAHWINNRSQMGDPSMSFAIDSGDHLRMSYLTRDVSTRHPIIEFATNPSGVWVFTKVAELAVSPDYDSNPYGWSKLAVDPTGHNHIAFTDELAGTLRYATDSGGTWTVTTIGSFRNSFYSSEPSSVSVGPSDRVHLFDADYGRRGSPLLYSSNAVDSTNVRAFAAQIQPLLTDEALVIAWVAGPLLAFPEASSAVSRWVAHRRAWKALRRAKYEELRRRVT